MNGYISEIRAFAFPFDIKFWLPCDGRSLHINQNLQLFQLIGTTFGGSGDTFNIPDLRDRVLIGNGAGRPDFAIGGEEAHSLSIQEMPRHSHQAVASSHDADTSTPLENFWPANAGYVTESNASMNAQAVLQVGFGTAHDNMSPYLAVNYAICISGVYPGKDFGNEDEYLGGTKMFAGKVESKHWLPCDGRLLPLEANRALFSLLGTYYGGDGVTNFAVPDLRGRAPVCWGEGAFKDLTPYKIGEAAGEESTRVTMGQMAWHFHPVLANVKGNSLNPSNMVWANQPGRPTVFCFAKEKGVGALMNPAALAEVGGDQPHNNMMPFQAIHFLIALTGEFPPRG